MIKPKSKRVGLLFVTREKDGKLTAHLEKRGSTNGGTWAGISLVTVGGKLTEDEHELTALHRLLKERLEKSCGQFAVMSLLDTLIANDPNKQILFKDDRLTLFYLVVPRDIFKTLKPTTDSNEFTKVTREDVGRLIRTRTAWKHQPHDMKGHIVVFPETLRALKVALKAL